MWHPAGWAAAEQPPGTPEANQGPTQRPVPPQGSPEGAQHGRGEASGQAAGAQALGGVLCPHGQRACR